MGRKRGHVVLVGTSLLSILLFRMELIEQIQAAGDRVTVVAPPDADAGILAAAGVAFVPWRLLRGSLAVGSEASAVRDLIATLRRLKPSVVHAYGLKAIIYAGLVPLPHVRLIATVTGLGFAFTQVSGPGRRLLRSLVAGLLRLTLRAYSVVFFLNPDDVVDLAEAGVRPRRVVVLEGGEGVDTRVFSPNGPGQGENWRQSHGLVGLPVVLLPARLLVHKGVLEFVEAAKILEGRAFFVLVGPADDGNPSAVHHDRVEEWVAAGRVHWIGPVSPEAMPGVLSAADIVVLPSYSEGLSRVLMEAAAVGRPTVTTDVRGCRHAISNEVTGLLVPPRDAPALADAIERIITDPEMARSMSQAGRALAESRFDVGKINAQILSAYGPTEA